MYAIRLFLIKLSIKIYLGLECIMAAVPNLNVKDLKKFTLLESLSKEKIKEVIEKATIQNIVAGRTLFKQGDKDQWTVFLLSGTIEVKSKNSPKITIDAHTEAAKEAIANDIPRPASARAKTNISIMIIDTDLLKLLLDFNAPSNIEVLDIDNDDEDWMTRFLQSSAFLQLPAANIQSLMMLLQETPMGKGTFVVKEDDENDNKFYIVQQGRCLVTKKNPVTGVQVTLAELRLGDSFGEEALITSSTRGASVIMKTDGVILTLDKKNFLDLLVNPLINRIDQTEIANLKETIQLIDVRNENEFAANGLAQSINIPINLIRSKLKDLSLDTHYILYSGQENRSIVATFLLIQQGFDCSIIKEGVGRATILSKKDTNNKQQGGNKTPIKNKSTASKQAHHTPLKKDSDNSELPQKPKKSVTTPEVAAQRRQAELQSKQLNKAETARKEAEATATELRNEAQEALKEVSEQAKKAQQAELALKSAQIKITQIERQEQDNVQTSGELNKIKQQVEKETHLKAQAEASRKKAEKEAKRLRLDANLAHKQAEKEAKRATQAESARKEAEEKAKKLHNETLKKKSDEVNHALEKAKSEADRAENAEHEASRLREEAEQARKKAEYEAKRAENAEQARKDAEEAIQQASQEQLSEKEAALKKAQEESQKEAERAEKAIEDAQRVREEAEQALKQSEKYAQLSSDAETELVSAKDEIIRLRKDADARQHAEIHEARIKAQEEKERAEKIDVDRNEALSEVKRLQQEMQETKKQMAHDLKNQQLEQGKIQKQQLGQLKSTTKDEISQMKAEMEAAQKSLSKEYSRLSKEQEKTLQKKINQAKIDANQHEKERLEAEKSRQNAQNEMQRLSDQMKVDKLERDKQEALRSAELVEAQQRIESANQRAQDAENSRQEFEEELQQIKAETEKARKTMDQVREDMAKELETERKDLEIAIKKQRQQMEDEKQAMADEAAKLEQEALKYQQETLAFQKEMEISRQQAQEEAKKLKEQLEQAKSEAQKQTLELNKQLEEIQEKKQLQEKSIALQKDELQRMQSEADEVRNQLAEKSVHSQNIERQNILLREKEEARRQAIETAKKQEIEEAKRRLDKLLHDADEDLTLPVLNVSIDNPATKDKK